MTDKEMDLRYPRTTKIVYWLTIVLQCTPVKTWRPDVSRAVLVQGYYRQYIRRPRRRGTTVAQFLRTLPRTGRFYLTSVSHAFAYVDGKLLDNLLASKMRALMTSCWEIKLGEKPEAKPESITPAQVCQIRDQILPSLTQAQINELWARMDRLEGKA